MNAGQGRMLVTTNRPRGGVLIEVVLAVALFVGAAGFTLGAMRSVFDGMDREDRRLRAVDLARSLLAELEAGLINLADLRGRTDGRVGSLRASPGGGSGSADEYAADVAHGLWRVDIHTERSRFPGLSLVELTVREDDELHEREGSAGRISVTLRQLMPLRESAPEEYEQDELIRDLPEREP